MAMDTGESGAVGGVDDFAARAAEAAQTLAAVVSAEERERHN